MATSAAAILAALARTEPAIYRAFLAWAAGLAAGVNVAEVERAVARGDAEAIAEAIGLTAASLAVVVEAVRTAFMAGGQFGVAELPPLRAAGARPGVRAPTLRVQFDVRNPRAEAWLQRHSAGLVTRILDEQRAGIRLVVSQGAMLGRNPRQTALDIVGRVSAQTGRRTGGIVGLSLPQAEYVSRARAQLLSGDPTRMAEYLTRARRDKRFDGIVRRAIAAGRPVAVADVERITARYADRLLLLRGETIARTESLAAFNEARDEAFRQGVELAGIEPEAVTKGWRTSGDGRVRDAHAAMNGQRVRFDQPFTSPTGAMMMHPGDTSLGAGAEDVINCRCTSVNRIDHLRAGRSRGR